MCLLAFMDSKCSCCLKTKNNFKKEFNKNHDCMDVTFILGSLGSLNLISVFLFIILYITEWQWYLPCIRVEPRDGIDWDSNWPGEPGNDDSSWWFFTNPFGSSKWESSLRKVEKYMKPPPGSVRGSVWKHERFLLLKCPLPTSCLENFAVRSQDGSYCTQGTRHLGTHFTNTFPPFTIFASAPPGHRSNKLLQSLAATWYQFIPWDSQTLLWNLVEPLMAAIICYILEISPVAHWCEILVEGQWTICTCAWPHQDSSEARRAHADEQDPQASRWGIANWPLSLERESHQDRCCTIQNDFDTTDSLKIPTTISIPLFRKRRVFSSQVQAQAPHFLPHGAAAARALLGRHGAPGWKNHGRRINISPSHHDKWRLWRICLQLKLGWKGRFRSHWSRFNVSTSWKSWHSKKIPLSTTSFPISNLYQQSTFQAHTSAMR